MTTYGVLGTGTVGRTFAGKLIALGHDVRMGTRDVSAAKARTEPDREGQESLAAWLETTPAVELVTFADAVGDTVAIVNATAGMTALDTLRAVPHEALEDRILIDVANPLDFSTGELGLTVSVSDSLGETLQRTFPGIRVVKAFNMMTAAVMVDPASVGGGDHTMFIAGNHDGAKAFVTELAWSFGWRDVRDLGDIAAARGMEAYLLLWLRGMQTFGTPMFNVKLVQ